MAASCSSSAFYSLSLHFVLHWMYFRLVGKRINLWLSELELDADLPGLSFENPSPQNRPLAEAPEIDNLASKTRGASVRSFRFMVRDPTASMVKPTSKQITFNASSPHPTTPFTKEWTKPNWSLTEHMHTGKGVNILGKQDQDSFLH